MREREACTPEGRLHGSQGLSAKRATPGEGLTGSSHPGRGATNLFPLTRRVAIRAPHLTIFLAPLRGSASRCTFFERRLHPGGAPAWQPGVKREARHAWLFSL